LLKFKILTQNKNKIKTKMKFLIILLITLALFSISISLVESTKATKVNKMTKSSRKASKKSRKSTISAELISQGFETALSSGMQAYAACMSNGMIAAGDLDSMSSEQKTAVYTDVKRKCQPHLMSLIEIRREIHEKTVSTKECLQSLLKKNLVKKPSANANKTKSHNPANKKGTSKSFSETPGTGGQNNGNNSTSLETPEAAPTPEKIDKWVQKCISKANKKSGGKKTAGVTLAAPANVTDNLTVNATGVTLANVRGNLPTTKAKGRFAPPTWVVRDMPSLESEGAPVGNVYARSMHKTSWAKLKKKF